MPALERIVDPAYRHVDKVVVPADVIGAMKWYDLAENDSVIDAGLRASAREVVRGLTESDDVGFVIIHACANEVTLLLVCRWRNNNEIWETVFVRRGDGEFEHTGDADPTRASYCVWELEIVNAERLAWIEFLRSERDEASLERYLSTARPSVT